MLYRIPTLTLDYNIVLLTDYIACGFTKLNPILPTNTLELDPVQSPYPWTGPRESRSRPWAFVTP